MPFNPQELEIIKWGASNGKSKDEVTQALTNFRTGTTPKAPVVEKPGMFQRVKEGIVEKGQKIPEILADESKSTLERATGATATGFSALSNTIYNALPDNARQALDTVGGEVGKGFNYVTDKLSELPAYQEYAKVANENPNDPMVKSFESGLKILSDLGLISGEILLADQTAKTGKLLDKGIEKAAVKGTELVEQGGQKIIEGAEKLMPKSPEIMNRVARLKPTDATKFEKLAGKSHGQYLTDTGNFGTPDKIIAKEAQKFAKSLQNVDDAFDKLPGVYKNGSIHDALTELAKKAKAESGANIKSPYLQRVGELQAKLNGTGLTMKEINEVKRLFEKNVKLGYNKIMSPEKVVQATNIDSSLRKWQVRQAQELGFKNIAELNKQTQLSKFIIDKLGDQVVGQSGLNGMNLTDWIVLSGGNPTAVSGFLTKKFFSSKAVQSKIAEMLNKGTPKGQIQADLISTPESIKRAVSPQGLEQLPAPAAGAPKSQVNVPINIPNKLQSVADKASAEVGRKAGAKRAFENSIKGSDQKLLSAPSTKAQGTPIYQPSRKAIEQGTEIVTRAKQSTPLLTEKLPKISSSSKVPQKYNLGKDLESSVTDWNRAIEAGDIPFAKIYKPNGTFQPASLKHVLSDITVKMNQTKAGLGDAFMKTVKGTFKPSEILKKAEDFILKFNK